MMVAQGGFDKKEEVENPSEVLLNPSDPEATFRYKAAYFLRTGGLFVAGVSLVNGTAAHSGCA